LAALTLTLLSVFLLESGLVQAQEEAPIVIGAVLSLTGRDAAFGEECLAGINIAIEEANAEGGAWDKSLRVEVYDDRSDPILAAEGVRVLVNEFHPLAIVGSNTSMVTKAAAVASQGVGVPLVMPEATNPGITSIGDCIFRVCFDDPDMANALATFAYEYLGLRKVAILMEEKHDYTLSLARYFGRRFTELGGEIVIKMGYEQGETKFDDPLRLVNERDADAILVSGFYPEAAAILASAKARKMKVAFLGGDAWESEDFFSMVGDAITPDSRVYVASHFSPDLQRIKVKGFVASFKEHHQRLPNTSSALGYDACGVVISAIGHASRPTPEAVKKALMGVHYEGVTGYINIDQTRNTSKRVIIMRAGADHRFSFVESVDSQKNVPDKTEDHVSP
jgi:branched-chain amino acid transport system substrate-binding protein